MKGVKIVFGKRSQKNLKSKQLKNPYGDMYRRRKSFFNFRDKSKSASSPELSPEPPRRQISEPIAPSSSNDCVNPRRQLSEPAQHSLDNDLADDNVIYIIDDNRNDDNNNPWELRKDDDVDIQEVQPKEGRLLTIYRTFWVKFCKQPLLCSKNYNFFLPIYADIAELDLSQSNCSCSFVVV